MYLQCAISLPPFLFLCVVTLLCCIPSLGSMSLPVQRRRTTGKQHPPPPTPPPVVPPPPPKRFRFTAKTRGSLTPLFGDSAIVHVHNVQCACDALHVRKRQQHSGNGGAGRAYNMVAVVQFVSTPCLPPRVDLTSVVIAVTQHLCQGTVDGQYYAPLFIAHVCYRPRTPCLILTHTKPVARSSQM